MVDLPGYGYAKASKKSRTSWEKFIAEYLLHRESLLTTFVLIDTRLEPQKIDLEFMNWCGEKGIPFSIIFTKTDKLSSSALQKNIAFYKKQAVKCVMMESNFVIGSSYASFIVIPQNMLNIFNVRKS